MPIPESVFILPTSTVYNSLLRGPPRPRQESHSVREHLEELLAQSLLHLQRDGVLPPGAEPTAQLERTRSPEHGEFASNVAMVLAKSAGRPPR